MAEQGGCTGSLWDCACRCWQGRKLRECGRNSAAGMGGSTQHAPQAALTPSVPVAPARLLILTLLLPSADGDDGLTLHFVADTHPPVKARLVVGADGSQSGVRAQLLDDGPPLFAGVPT